MKLMEKIYKIMLIFCICINIFYRNKYTFGLFVLALLFGIVINIIKTPKKILKFIYILLGFIVIILFSIKLSS